MAEEGKKAKQEQRSAIVLNYLSRDSVFPFGSPWWPFKATNAL